MARAVSREPVCEWIRCGAGGEAGEMERSRRVGFVGRRSQDEPRGHDERGSDEEQEEVPGVPGRGADPALQPQELPVAQDGELDVAFDRPHRVGKGSCLVTVDEEKQVAGKKSRAGGRSGDPDAETALFGSQEEPRLPRGRDLSGGCEADRDEENEQSSEDSPPENSRAPPSQVPHPNQGQANEVPRIRIVGTLETASVKWFRARM